MPYLKAISLCILGLVCLGGASAVAQTATISGVVLDAESGETLPHATVRIETLAIGAATNLDGYFVLLGAKS